MHRTIVGVWLSLVTAAAIAGCNTKASTSSSFVVGNVDLNNPDDVPASAISTFNVASDGGGLSGNGQSVGIVLAKFNTGSNTGADGSAIIVFTTIDQGGGTMNGQTRLFAAYFDGSSLTPPTELKGADKADIGANPTVTSILLCPLNTSRYQGATADATRLVAANAGNWAIVWDCVTASQNPIAQDAVKGPLQATPALGPHRTLYYTLFVKSLRGTPSAFSQILGFGAGGTGTPAAPSRLYEYGFLKTAIEIPTNRGGENLLNQNAPDFNSAASRRSRPAEDVISYGMATDTIRGAASFTAGFAGVEPTPIVTGTNGAGLVLQPQLGTSTTQTGTFGAPTGAGTAGPFIANYELGDATTFLRLFYVQIASSRAGSTAVTSDRATGASTAEHAGQRYALFSTGFDLSTLAWAAPVEVKFPASRATATTPWATQPLPNITTYNQHVFIRYLDGSLSGDPAGTGGRICDIGRTGVAFPGNSTDLDDQTPAITRAMAVFTASDSGNGQNAVNAGLDVTLFGANGKHSTAVAAANAFFPPASNRVTARGTDEWVDFGPPGAGAPVPIYGADEGLADTTVFLLQQCNTIVAANNTTELRLVSAAFKADGTLQTGANPKVLSTHAAETVGGSPSALDDVEGGTSQALKLATYDSVSDFSTCMTRDGHAILVAFRQFEGNTSGGHLRLKAMAYAPPPTGGTVTNFDTRFSTESILDTPVPITVRGDIASFKGVRGTPAGGAGLGQLTRVLGDPLPGKVGPVPAYNNLTGGQENPGPQGLFGPTSTGMMAISAVPVTDYMFQGNVKYRCGVQSDVGKVSILFVTSDGTEDRVFIDQLTVTTTAATPTLTAAAAAEIDATQSVTGNGIPDPVDNTRATIKSTFRFLPFSVLLARDFVTTDAGADSSGKGGGVLVVFQKITDGTTSDSDFYDRQVIASLYDGLTITDRVVISRQVDPTTGKENNSEAGAGGGQGANVGGTVFRPAPPVLTGYKTGLVGLSGNLVSIDDPRCSLVALPTNGDIATKPSYSTDEVVILFHGPTGDNNKTPQGVWARVWDQTIRRTSATATTSLDKQFLPNAAAAPYRLDRDVGADAVVAGCLQAGRTILVLIGQDRHLWGSIAADTTGFSHDSSGAPAPGLVDNDTSANATFLGSGVKTTTSCEDLHGSIVFFAKPDIDGNLRLKMRAWN